MRGGMTMLMVAVLCLLAGVCLAAADWPLPQGDRALTNRSPLKGMMQQAPTERWRVQTGAWSGRLEVVAGGRDEGSITLEPHEGPARTLPSFGGRGGRKRNRPQPDWRVRLLDVAGTGTPVPVADGYWGKLIPQRRGLQRVAWTGTWGEGPERIQCFSYEEGYDRPRLEWETEPVTTVYSPQICLADVNGDGEIEVVTALHYRILIYEGHSGRKLHELRYHGLRNYGFFGVFFEPGEPEAKFVNISDFANHLDVISLHGGQLQVAFRRDVEGVEAGGITRHQKVLRPGPNPLEDVDGDGRVELVCNLFNDEGDGRWHVVGYQPLTGTQRLDLAGQYLVGMYDVDGCGRPELLCQAVRDRHTTGWGQVSVLKVEGKQVRTLFREQRARFATFDLRYLPPTADTGAAGGKTTAAAGQIGPHGEPGFILLRPGREGRPAATQAYLWSRAGFTPGWQVTAPAQGALAVQAVEGRDYGSTLPAGRPARVALSVSGSAPNGTLAVSAATARLEWWRPQAEAAPRPIVLNEGDRLLLVTEAGNERIQAYALEGDRPRLLWERRGYGMSTGSGRPGGLAAGDLDGDGQAEVLFAQEAPTGAAALLAVGLDGHIRWRRTFPGFDSGRPQWNWGGLTLWTPAHLTSRGRLDVYVQLRRSTMHSDLSYALAGRTGEVLWQGDQVPIAGKPTWGFGGAPVAAVDLLGNGLEQLVSLYPVCYYVVDGRDGSFVRTVDLAAQTVLPGWAAYAVPVVADFLGDGGLQVYVPSPYVHGLLTAEGAAIWSAPAPAHLAGSQVGDFDGDDRLEVARVLLASGQEGGRVQLLDGATGQEKLSLSLLDPKGQGLLAMDVNADGRDELLLRTAPGKLGAVALGKSNPGLIWEASLPADPVWTIAAQVAGQAQLIVGCEDGSLVGLGSEIPARSPSVTR